MQTNSLILIGLCYFFSIAFFARYLKTLSYGSLRFGRWLLGLAVAFHWGLLVAWLRKGDSFAPANSQESQLAILAALGFLSWILSARKSRIFMVTLAEILICLGLVGFQFFSGTELSASLPNPWLWTHIVLALLGETFFLFSALISSVYLIVDFQLRRRQLTPLFSRLPSLVEFDTILGENLLVGFVLLTVGLVLGLLFASEYWMGKWFFDSKVIFALLTWCFYAVVLSLRWYSPIYRGRRTALFAVIGFFGILLLSIGQHSRAEYGVEKVGIIENGPPKEPERCIANRTLRHPSLRRGPSDGPIGGALHDCTVGPFSTSPRCHESAFTAGNLA